MKRIDVYMDGLIRVLKDKDKFNHNSNFLIPISLQPDDVSQNSNLDTQYK